MYSYVRLYLILIALAISPLAYMAGKPMDMFDTMVFQIFAIAIGLLGIKQNFHSKSFLLATGFLASALASTAFKEFNQIAMFSFVNMFLATNLIMAVSSDEEAVEWIDKNIGWIFILPIALNLIVLIWHWMGFNPIIENKTGEPGGLLGNSPRLCMYLAIVLPFVFDKSKLLALIIGFIGVVLKEVYLPFFCMFLFIAKDTFGGKDEDISYYNSFIKFLCLLGFVLAPFTFYRQKIIESLTIRMDVWLPTLEQSFKSLWFGYGPGVFQHVSPQFVKKIIGVGQGFIYADNSFSSIIQIFFSQGMVGLICFGFIVRFFLKHWEADKYDMSLLFLLIMALFEYPFEVPKLWLTICIIVGVKIVKIRTWQNS